MLLYNMRNGFGLIFLTAFCLVYLALIGDNTTYNEARNIGLEFANQLAYLSAEQGGVLPQDVTIVQAELENTLKRNGIRYSNLVITTQPAGTVQLGHRRNVILSFDYRSNLMEAVYKTNFDEQRITYNLSYRSRKFNKTNYSVPDLSLLE